MAQETTFAPRRHEPPERSSTSCRKRELAQINKVEAIREYPCDEMHSEHQQRCDAQGAPDPPRFPMRSARREKESPVAMENLGGTLKCWSDRLASKMRCKNKFFLQTQQIPDWHFESNKKRERTTFDERTNSQSTPGCCDPVEDRGECWQKPLRVTRS